MNKLIHQLVETKSTRDQAIVNKTIEVLLEVLNSLPNGSKISTDNFLIEKEKDIYNITFKGNQVNKLSELLVDALLDSKYVKLNFKSIC